MEMSKTVITASVVDRDGTPLQVGDRIQRYGALMRIVGFHATDDDAPWLLVRSLDDEKMGNQLVYAYAPFVRKVEDAVEQKPSTEDELRELAIELVAAQKDPSLETQPLAERLINLSVDDYYAEQNGISTVDIELPKEKANGKRNESAVNATDNSPTVINEKPIESIIKVGSRVIYREHPRAMDDWTIQVIQGSRAKCFSANTQEHATLPLAELELYTLEKAFPQFDAGALVKFSDPSAHTWFLPDAENHIFEVKYQHLNGMVPVIDTSDSRDMSFHCTSLELAHSSSVVNVKFSKEYDVYIGRANRTYGLPQSKWHNPFVASKHDALGECLQKYADHILGNAELMASLPELDGKTTACWCAKSGEKLTVDDPLRCHGQVLMKIRRGDYAQPNNCQSNESTMSTTTIDPEILGILERVKIDGQNVRLTETLDTKTYKRVNDVLTRIGGTWKSGKVKAHVFPPGKNPAALLEEILSTGKKPEKNPLGYFPTQPPTIKLIMDKAKELLPRFPDCAIAETSAGEGAIADEIIKLLPDSTANLTLIELDEHRCELLSRKYPTSPLIKGDFLKQPVPETLLDIAIINPPFAVEGSPQAYIDHIMRTAEWIREGGSVVAIAPGGFTFSRIKKIAKFREFVKENGGWIDLEDGAFKDSGTNVKAVMLWFTIPNKPTQAENVPELEVEVAVVEPIKEQPEFLQGNLFRDFLFGGLA